MQYFASLRTFLIVGCVAVSSLASAQKVPLIENRYYMDQLFSGVVADQIRKNCPTISARYFKAMAKLNALRQEALDEGYTETEIRQTVRSKANRRAMEADVRAYLASRGVTAGDPESFCRLGRAEIAKNSLTGSLIHED